MKIHMSMARFLEILNKGLAEPDKEIQIEGKVTEIKVVSDWGSESVTLTVTDSSPNW